MFCVSIFTMELTKVTCAIGSLMLPICSLVCTITFWAVGIFKSYSSADVQDSNMSDCLTIDPVWRSCNLSFNSLYYCIIYQWSFNSVNVYQHQIGVLSKVLQRWLASKQNSLRLIHINLEMVHWKLNNVICFGSNKLDEILIMSQFHEQDIQKRKTL